MDGAEENASSAELELLRALGEAARGGDGPGALLEAARGALGLARLVWRAPGAEPVVAPPRASVRSLEPRAHAALRPARSPRADPGRPRWTRRIDVGVGEGRRATLALEGPIGVQLEPGVPADLARVLGALHELEAQRARRARDARLVALGRGTARLLHDVRHRVTCALAALRAGEGEEELARELTRLRALAASPALGEEREREPLALADELSDAIRAAGRAARRSGRVQVRLRCPRSLRAALDAVCLGRLVTNLVQNAIEATPDGGEVRVAVRKLGADELELLVQDRGPGLPPAALERLEALDGDEHEHDEGRELRGLGLASAHEAARTLGGRLALESTPGLGTAVRVRLPLAPRGLERVRPRAALLVDPDGARRAACAAGLRDGGVGALEAATVEQALALVAAPGTCGLLLARGTPGPRLGELARLAGELGLATWVLPAGGEDPRSRGRRLAAALRA